MKVIIDTEMQTLKGRGIRIEVHTTEGLMRVTEARVHERVSLSSEELIVEQAYVTLGLTQQ